MITLTLLLVLMNGSACNEEDALAAALASATAENLRVDDLTDREVLGPFSLSELIRRRRVSPPEKVASVARERPLWWVKLGHPMPALGGEYEVFIDAESCSVIGVQRGR